ncbi:MAG TPA: CPBP family glutamic-type intramembrane protease [Kofleriaceae bacterium]|nr:CPBP family glutamic-type intramembrane protease [Kofleriaceae bacterium]
MSEPARGATGRGDLAASLVLIFPLLLAYEIGVAFAGRVNGADVVTRALYDLLGSRALYLAFHAVVALLFLVWIRRARRWQTLSFDIAAPVVLEAAIYALTLGAVIRLVLDRAFGLGGGATVVGALGAGVHEELVFRLGLVAGIVMMVRGRLAFPIALVVSSLAFAAAHHLGPYGEPFSAHAFAFRALAGAAFAAIFWFRSLAHAVYAHVLYDLVVAWS